MSITYEILILFDFIPTQVFNNVIIDWIKITNLETLTSKH